ncbi:MAG: hypothetical protein HQK49_03840 [Oligoflexia bacterium]|nr:hypothetical protein [Oligoflexia bacterium]
MIEGIYNQFKYHPMIILLITLLTIIPVLVGSSIWMWGPWFIFSLLVFFNAGLAWITFAKVFLSAFLLSFSVLVLSILYPAPNFMFGEKITFFWGQEVYMDVLNMALLNFKRLMLLSIISMNSSFVIGLDRLVLYVVAQNKRYVNLCYAILVALNSITLLKEERERIDIVAKFRGIPKRKRLITIFPLLVFAVKHSQRAAMAMLARGINKDKTYYFNYVVSDNDRINMKVLILFYIIHLIYYFITGLNEMNFSIWRFLT